MEFHNFLLCLGPVEKHNTAEDDKYDDGGTKE